MHNGCPHASSPAVVPHCPVCTRSLQNGDHSPPAFFLFCPICTHKKLKAAQSNGELQPSSLHLKRWEHRHSCSSSGAAGTALGSPDGAFQRAPRRSSPVSCEASCEGKALSHSRVGAAAGAGSSPLLYPPAGPSGWQPLDVGFCSCPPCTVSRSHCSAPA